MPRLKAKPEMAQFQPEVRPPDTTTVRLTEARADMTAHQSPALALQVSLEKSWEVRREHDSPAITKIPFGWTLAGMSIMCAGFWYVLLQLVF